MHAIIYRWPRYLISLFLIITLNFALPRMMPGDPIANLIGESAYVSEATILEITETLGLNRPLHEQFILYLQSLARFDLGYSYLLHAEVSSIIIERMIWTLSFVGIATLIGVVLGVLLGAVAGMSRSKKSSQLWTYGSIAVSSTPPYFLGLIALSVFSFHLGLFPLKGAPATGGILTWLHHLALPIAVLALFIAARNCLIMRGSVIQELHEHYPLYAKAKGLTEGMVLRRHILKNASLPVITQIALDIGFIFSGALFIEIVFSMPGMGMLIYDAVLSRDYPILEGCLLVIAIMVILANIAADILYGIIDPRIRRGE
ncbi:peptide/nickel transport system permease protein [Methanocalculus alkaliphilus]|uniref:ABC transporter permease n=1 Tax=Methanocalculus alkaliphilus TaxID=768730 RepID=UPI00209E7438|nr:ABC transporter permease [Methanocalculus alkaliphilus]MCP1714478.1 peptide/nickel transport system permease protein [Methanocalculus alkaliphilus]